jgi:elongation factor Ts
MNSEGIKYLRETTGAGYVMCKKALDQSSGNIDEAVKELRKSGAATAMKKAGRDANEGVVGCYLHHNGKVGAMVEVNCETDFAAGTNVLKDFAKDIAMHIAAASPEYIKAGEVPDDIIKEEKEVYLVKAEKENIPDRTKQKYLEGKLRKFYTEKCLLEQKYFRDSSFLVKDILNTSVAKIGENVIIKRFCRYEVG